MEIRLKKIKPLPPTRLCDLKPGEYTGRVLGGNCYIVATLYLNKTVRAVLVRNNSHWYNATHSADCVENLTPVKLVGLDLEELAPDA